MTAVAEPEGHPVLVARTSEGVAVFDGICTHARFRFVASALVGGSEIECPMHGARFDATTGMVRCGPARTALRRLESRIVEGIVEVAVDDVKDEEEPSVVGPDAGSTLGGWGAWSKPGRDLAVPSQRG